MDGESSNAFRCSCDPSELFSLADQMGAAGLVERAAMVREHAIEVASRMVVW